MQHEQPVGESLSTPRYVEWWTICLYYTLWTHQALGPLYLLPDIHFQSEQITVFQNTWLISREKIVIAAVAAVASKKWNKSENLII